MTTLRRPMRLLQPLFRPSGRHALRRSLATVLPMAMLSLLAAGPVTAQEATPRTWFTGWLGGFADIGGFSEEGPNAFYRFDGAFSFGAGVHRALGQSGPVVGVDVLLSKANYERFARSAGAPEGSGEARILSALASTRLEGGGLLGFYLSAGAGLFAWDLDDPDLEDGYDFDPALQLAAGLEYRLQARLRLFADYGQWWVFHEKDPTIVSNTANHNLVRVGVRLGL